MSWELAGDLFLCFSIVAGIALFTYVNVSYNPNDDQ